jgi:hypothetical protein
MPYARAGAAHSVEPTRSLDTAGTPLARSTAPDQGIRDRFRWHAEQGHPLPKKYKDRILAALGIDPAELQETLELLGLAEPAPP